MNGSSSSLDSGAAGPAGNRRTMTPGLNWALRGSRGLLSRVYTVTE